MKLSIYTSAFNLISSKIDYQSTLVNFCSFADEVVISTLNDNDDSYNILNSIRDYSNLKIILSDKQQFTPEFDGAIKNDALQACSGDVLIGLDCDERVRLKDKNKWLRTANLLADNRWSAVMIPVVDLYGCLEKFSSIGSKWYMHKSGLKRGVVKYAKRPDGTHDTEISDSCELLDDDNNLVPSWPLLGHGLSNPEDNLKYIIEQEFPLVYHIGHVDLQRRLDINSSFWSHQWAAENGSKVKLPQTIEELNVKKTYPFSYPLWNE